MKLEDLRKISEAATKGPWDYTNNYTVDAGTVSAQVDAYNKRQEPFIDVAVTCNANVDAEFIAQARNHFDALLDVAEAARQQIESGNFIHQDSGLWDLEEALERLEGI